MEKFQVAHGKMHTDLPGESRNAHHRNNLNQAEIQLRATSS
jgi:hypothetical protein